MKSKKVILTTCAMVFCAFVGCVGFVSCNSDEDVNKALLENNGLLKSCMKETGSAYCPLNIIPQQVLSKMTDEEYLLFDSLSRDYHIDYSFFSSTYYEQNKNYILRELRRILSEGHPNDCTTAYLTIEYEETKFNGIERMAPAESGWPNTTSIQKIMIFENTTAPNVKLYADVKYNPDYPYNYDETPDHSFKGEDELFCDFNGHTKVERSYYTLTCKTNGKIIYSFGDTILINNVLNKKVVKLNGIPNN